MKLNKLKLLKLQIETKLESIYNDNSPLKGKLVNPIQYNNFLITIDDYLLVTIKAGLVDYSFYIFNRELEVENKTPIKTFELYKERIDELEKYLRYWHSEYCLKNQPMINKE